MLHKSCLFLCGLFGVTALSYSVELPEDCLKDLDNHKVCVRAIPLGGTDYGSIEVTAAVVASHQRFSDQQAVVQRYFDWPQWPQYYQDSGYKKVKMLASQTMEPLTEHHDGQAVTFMRHYFIVETQAPIIGAVKARGVSFYEEIAAEPLQQRFAFTLAKGQVEVPEGEQPLKDAEGLQRQDGELLFRSCTGTQLCPALDRLVVYKAYVRPANAVFPQQAAKLVRRQFEALFQGMYFTAEQ